MTNALDPRLPPPGTYLEREYKGRQIIVKILVNGFEFDGAIWHSTTVFGPMMVQSVSTEFAM